MNFQGTQLPLPTSGVILVGRQLVTLPVLGMNFLGTQLLYLLQV